MDGREEVVRAFVVTCGNGPELLQFGKEVLDAKKFSMRWRAL